MIQNHPSEIELQRLFDAPDCIADDLAEHLDHCDVCKARLEAYRAIFVGLKESEKPVFNFDLAQAVVDQLPSTKRNLPWAAILTACVGIFGTATIVWVYSPLFLRLFHYLPHVEWYMLLFPVSVILILQSALDFKEFRKKENLLG